MPEYDVKGAIDEFRKNTKDFQRRLQRNENVAFVLQSATEALNRIRERQEQKRLEKQEQEKIAAENAEHDRRKKLEYDLDEERGNRIRLQGMGDAASERERQERVKIEDQERYAPQIDEFLSVFEKAEATGDRNTFAKAKMLLGKIPSEQRPVEMKDVEQSLDNWLRRKNEGTTVSAALQKQQELKALTDSTIKNLLTQGKIKEEDVPALSWMMMAQPDNAVEFIGGMLSAKLNPESKPGDDLASMSEQRLAANQYEGSPVLSRRIPTQAGIALLESDEEEYNAFPAQGMLGRGLQWLTGNDVLKDSVEVGGEMVPTSMPFSENFPTSKYDINRVSLGDELIGRFPNKYPDTPKGNIQLSKDIEEILGGLGLKKPKKEDVIDEIFSARHNVNDFSVSERAISEAIEALKSGVSPERVEEAEVVTDLRSSGLSEKEIQSLPEIMRRILIMEVERIGSR